MSNNYVYSDVPRAPPSYKSQSRTHGPFLQICSSACFPPSQKTHPVAQVRNFEVILNIFLFLTSISPNFIVFHLNISQSHLLSLLSPLPLPFSSITTSDLGHYCSHITEPCLCSSHLKHLFCTCGPGVVLLIPLLISSFCFLCWDCTHGFTSL